jgi:hypothetical protein
MLDWSSLIKMSSKALLLVVLLVAVLAVANAQWGYGKA